MSDAKHTPGPWAVGYHDGSGAGDDENEGAYVLVPSHATQKAGDIIIVVRGGRDDWGQAVGVVGRSQAEKLANARLIAAAPDLLESLEIIASWDEARHKLAGEHQASLIDIIDSITAHARRTIAKATGQ